MALSTDERRSQLEAYAQKELGDDHTTKAQAFVNILDHEVDLVSGVDNPASAMIQDLTAVLVGDDKVPLYFDEYLYPSQGGNRGQGPYYAGDHVGSSGFKPQFQEDAEHNTYQVQHAMAGIGISYGYPLEIENIVLGQENYQPDIELYKATFNIGNDLAHGKLSYNDLAQEVAVTIGDSTVYPNSLLVDFEGFGLEESLPNGYKGLTWNNFESVNGTTYFPPSGYERVINSGMGVGYNADGNPASFTSVQDFDLVNGYFAAAWNNNMNVRIEGWDDGTLRATKDVVLNPSKTPLTFNASFRSIDEVHISSSGGTHAGFNGAGTQVAIDDLLLGFPDAVSDDWFMIA